LNDKTITSALDNMDVSRFHFKMLLLSAAGVFLDGYDLFIISVVLLFIRPLWINVLPLNQQSIILGLLTSSAFIGMFFGALTLGHYTDKMGRKTMYVMDLIFFVVFATLSALSQNIWELILFRFLLGLGIGADYPISSTYVTEFSPTKVRGKLISTTFMFWGLGALTAALVGYLIALVQPLGIDSWRLMLLSGIVPAIIVIILRATMPESPRWLISQGKQDKAIEVLKSLNVNVTGLEVQQAKKEKATIKELLSPIYRRRTIFAWVPWFFMDVGVYGIGMYLPTLLYDLGFKNALSSIIGTAFLDIFGIIGFTLAIILIDKYGRLKLQALGFLGMTLSLLLLGILGPVNLVFLFIIFAIFQISENAGPNTTTWVVATELFPTRLRATAQGSSAAVSRLGAITGVFLLPVITGIFGNSIALLFVSASTLLGLIVTLLLGEETKALSLEEASTVFREFSSYIVKLTSNVEDAAKELYKMSTHFDKVQEISRNIKIIEHKNDEIVSEIFTKLNRKFPAPIDNLDIAALVKGLDDIIDSIESTSKKMLIYDIKKPTNEIIALSEINLKAVSELKEALNEIMGIRLGEYTQIIEICKDIHKLENFTDDIVDNVIKELLSSNDPMLVLRYKEIYESMESITDRCDDVSDIIMSLIVKYS